MSLLAKVSQTKPRGSSLKGVMVKMLAQQTQSNIRIHLEEVLQPPAVWPRLTTYKVMENKQEWAAALAEHMLTGMVAGVIPLQDNLQYGDL